jgi:signal transduction histidine kinase
MEALEENGGGTIKISALKRKDSIDVVIENNGPKIDEEIREHIFERFTSSKGTSNSGFGLHIVKQILERNGWKVKVFSTDRRTAFEFVLNDIQPSI